MIQVTAIYQGSEIGYGEGESLQYAIEECASGISAMFEDELVQLMILEYGAKRQLSGRVYLTIDGETAIAN